ncbi:ROK family protein, partial [Geodermatophilus arenarius]
DRQPLGSQNDMATIRLERARRAADGEPAARAAADGAARALRAALAGVLNVLDVPIVVLGGHLGELAAQLCPALEETLGRRVLSARWRRPRVEAALAAPAAGATGAALRALAGVVADPARWLRPH